MRKGVYQHYKGGFYTVVGMGTDERTRKPVVIYRDRNGLTWVRPESEFRETVDGDPRFELVERKMPSE